MSKSIQGSMAELAHNRHTETNDYLDFYNATRVRQHPSCMRWDPELDERWPVARFWPLELNALFFLEAAVNRHMASELLEQEQLREEYGDVEGYNLWAERYKLPTRMLPREDVRTPKTFYFKKKGHVIALLEKSKAVAEQRRDLSEPYKLEVRSRGQRETAKEYKAFLKAETRRFIAEAVAEDKRRQKERRKLDQFAEMTIHAEWFVLYQCKKWSVETISRKGPPYCAEGGKSSTIYKGAKSFADLVGADLRGKL